MTRLAIFASGTGTNFEAIMQSIINKDLKAEVVLLVCDHLDALVITKASKYQVPVFKFNPKNYSSKSAYEAEIVKQCQTQKVDLIVLAGYMRILDKTLLAAYPNKIINIHPSLLPAFKGKDAIGQAINYGVKVMGVSIHYVNSEMDGGKIIAQCSFEVLENMTPKDIEAKIHQIEHVLYPKTIKKLIEEEAK